MNEIKAPRLAMVYAGCFLGAGYVSGQELWQYFGVFGAAGYCGLGVAVLLLAGCGILILRSVQLIGTEEADRLMVPWDIKLLRFLSAALAMLLMFAIVMIMTAGVGALCEQLTGMPHIFGSAAFALLVLFIALSGVNGLINAFSATVPVLIVCTVIFGIATLSRCGLPDFSVHYEPKSGLIGSSPLLAAFNFVSYNTFGTIPILTPIGGRIKKRGTIAAGVALGCFALLLIALSVLTSVAACDGSADAELPMLYAAAQLAPWAAYVYAILLFAGMFGTALSSFVGFINLLEEKSDFIRLHRTSACIVLIIIAFIASLYGFGDLIGVLYPLFGYASIVFLLMMLVRYIQLTLKK